MKSLHAKRRAETSRKVMAALALLEREQRKITFSLVSEIAGVSRPTLYNNPTLKSAIEGKIKLQQDAGRRLERKLKSDSATISKLKKTNGELRKQISWQRDLINAINNTGPIDLDYDFKIEL